MKISIDSLKVDISFKSDLMIDDTFIVIPAQVSVTENLLKILKAWNFSEFECLGDISLDEKFEVKQNQEPLVTQEVSVEAFETPKEKSQKIENIVKQSLSQENLTLYEKTENSKLESVHKLYNEYMEYINSVYTYYATHTKISLEELSTTVRDLCNFIKMNKRYVLRVSPSIEARTKNFLVVHSMRSTVLAITMGIELNIPQSKLIELGMCCILHEIGMIRLPPQLYMTDKPLSDGEKAQIKTHPLIGFNIVKSQNFPLSIQLGVLEHHEKENGTGYPRKLTGDKISVFAKIISVACSFEAITAPRQYKEERTTFDAMVEMLKNQNNQYNGVIIKALLYSLSLFPIGAYVFLKTGKIAVVTDVNPNNPKNPVIQILNEFNSDGTPKTVNSDENEYKIIRVLNKKEQEDILKNLNSAPPPKESKPKPEKKQPLTFDSVDLSEFN